MLSDATLRFLKACKSVDHPPALAVAMRVCCHHEPAGPREKGLLKDGKNDLVRHFRRER